MERGSRQLTQVRAQAAALWSQLPLPPKEGGRGSPDPGRAAPGTWGRQSDHAAWRTRVGAAAIDTPGPQTTPREHVRCSRGRARFRPRGDSVTRASSSQVWRAETFCPASVTSAPRKGYVGPRVHLLHVISSLKTPGVRRCGRGTWKMGRSRPGEQQPARSTVPKPKGTVRPSGAHRMVPEPQRVVPAGPLVEADERPCCPCRPWRPRRLGRRVQP